jgi:hypothetical protein
MERKMLQTSLSYKQVIISSIIGMVLWFCAAKLMHVIVKQNFYNGYGITVTYALTIPGTIPFVILLRKLVGLRTDQIAIGYTIATTAALLLDGAVFAFFPSLYADNAADALQAAAAILWGAGVGQVLALVINKEGTV